MVKTGVTSRAQQAADTRKRIIKCAKSLIKKKGFDNVSVQLISQEAGITVGTFYYYFSTKEELLLEFLPKASAFDHPEDAGEIHSYMLVVELFTKLVNYFRTASKSTCDLWCYILKSFPAVQAINSERIPRLERIVKRGQERGEFTSAVDAREIAEVLTYTNRGVFLQFVNGTPGLDYVEMAMEVISRISYSYLTEQGRATVPPEFKPKWACK